MLQLKLFCTFLQTGWAVSFENPRSQNVWHANFSQVWVSKMTVDASMTLRSKKNWNQSRYNRKLADVLFEGLSVFPQRWIKSVHIIFLIFLDLFVFPFKEKLIFLDEFQVPSSSCKKAVESAPWHEELKWHGRSRWKQCENWFLGWKNGFKLVEIDTQVVTSDFRESLYLNKRDLWFQENLTTNMYPLWAFTIKQLQGSEPLLSNHQNLRCLCLPLWQAKLRHSWSGGVAMKPRIPKISQDPKILQNSAR